MTGVQTCALPIWTILCVCVCVCVFVQHQPLLLSSRCVCLRPCLHTHTHAALLHDNRHSSTATASPPRQPSATPGREQCIMGDASRVFNVRGVLPSRDACVSSDGTGRTSNGRGVSHPAARGNRKLSSGSEIRMWTGRDRGSVLADRKSTRLNSSH